MRNTGSLPIVSTRSDGEGLTVLAVVEATNALCFQRFQMSSSMALEGASGCPGKQDLGSE